jgi:serralysin
MSDDIIDGGSGYDVVVYGIPRADATITLLENGDIQVVSDEEGTDILRDIEAISFIDITISLANYGREINGTEADDELVGTDFGDYISGLDGDDILNGSAGDDTLIGGDGDDTLIGGSGADIMQAGAGNDTVWYSYGDVFLDSAGRAIDVGGAGRDALRVEAGSHFNSANLSIYGFEEFHGAERDDRAVGLRDDVDYHLSGGAGNDELQSAGGEDTLEGGAGNDTLHGGAGSDAFHFNMNDDEDIIADFEDDIDTLVFTGLGDIDDVGNVASQVGTDVVFNFGSGDVLIVRDTTIAAVLDDIEIA